MFYAQIVRWSKRVRLSIRAYSHFMNLTWTTQKNCTRWEKYLLEIPFNHQNISIKYQMNNFFSLYILEIFRVLFLCFFFIRHSECVGTDLTFGIAQKFDLFIKSLANVQFQHERTLFFFFFWVEWWTHSFRFADSCTDASLLLAKLKNRTQPNFKSFKIICGIHKKSGHRYKFLTVISDYIFSKNAFHFFL